MTIEISPFRSLFTKRLRFPILRSCQRHALKATALPLAVFSRVILESRAGEGGEDARMFCGDLLRMYERYCRKIGWEIELLDENRDGNAVRSAVCEVSGNGVERLHGEAGTHTVQHVTMSRRKDRVHSSNASVVVLNVERNEGEQLFRSGDVRIDTFRGSGKGGQHRNKTDSAVRALHVPTGEMATVTSGRSQGKNREAALAVLAARLGSHAQARRDESVQRRRRQSVAAGRSESARTYDLVRGVVRCDRTGVKVQQARRVLNGELQLVIGGFDGR